MGGCCDLSQPWNPLSCVNCDKKGFGQGHQPQFHKMAEWPKTEKGQVWDAALEHNFGGTPLKKNKEHYFRPNKKCCHMWRRVFFISANFADFLRFPLYVALENANLIGLFVLCWKWGSICMLRNVQIRSISTIEKAWHYISFYWTYNSTSNLVMSKSDHLNRMREDINFFNSHNGIHWQMSFF